MAKVGVKLAKVGAELGKVGNWQNASDHRQDAGNGSQKKSGPAPTETSQPPGAHLACG